MLLQSSLPARDPTLDIFRAVAVIFVVLFHYTARLPREVFGATDSVLPAISFGWVGVYFFFIISGFCIFYTLEKAPTIWTFFAKRFSRIYPVFIAATVLLFALDQVFQLPILPEYHYREVAPTIVDMFGNLLLLGGIFEWVNGSFWSITVEVQFYVFIGMLAMVIKDARKLGIMFAYAAIVIGTSWILLTLLSEQFQVFSVLATVLQKVAIAPFLPFFALGIVGVFVKKDRRADRNLFWFLVVLSTMCLMIIGAKAEATANGYNLLFDRNVFSAVAFLALAALFYAYCTGWQLPHLPFVSSGLAYIGLLSFSWYLLHENLGFLILGALNPALPYWLSVLVAIGATFGAAVLFSQAFEWRFRKLAEHGFSVVLDIAAKRMPKKLSDGLV